MNATRSHKRGSYDIGSATAMLAALAIIFAMAFGC